MKNYEKYMKKCLKLARKGEGRVSPNPLVGCVVLDKNGKEISCGFHSKYGEAHAEADALGKLKNQQAQGGVLIVNLEPCAHFGKTPPCADLIIKHKIKTLIVGMSDPHKIVDGRGIEKCKKAGIKVIEGILEKDCLKLNEIFVKNVTEKAAFVAIKTATTIDGKIAAKTGDSKWITSEKSRKYVQSLRNNYDAILTTSSTVIKDNPSMTCRMKNGRNPAKIIIDRELKTDLNSNIYKSTGEKIYVAVDKNIDIKRLSGVPKHIQIIKCPAVGSKLDLKFLFKKLFELGIMSILVEAGGKLNSELISLGLADKIYHFVAPKIIADKNAINAFEGREVNKISDTVDFQLESVKKISPDFLAVYLKKQKTEVH